MEKKKSIDPKTAFSFATNVEEENYLKISLRKTKSIVDLKDWFYKSSPDMVDLVSQMLEFNHYIRPSAEKLLAHKAFDQIRDPSVEIKAPYKIIFSPD